MNERFTAQEQTSIYRLSQTLKYLRAADAYMGIGETKPLDYLAEAARQADAAGWDLVSSRIWNIRNTMRDTQQDLR